MVYDYVIGMDVGKYFHHACVLDSHGAQVLSKRINQNEQSLRALFSDFCSGNNKVLVVVDQPNNIGRLTVAVAQDLGIDVRYLPGLAMRQLSRIHAVMPKLISGTPISSPTLQRTFRNPSAASTASKMPSSN